MADRDLSSRRGLLRAGAVAATTALAGCSQNSDDPEPEERSDPGGNDSGAESSDEPVDVPDEYVLAPVPGTNESLRRDIPDEQLERYEREFGTDLITESNVFREDLDEEWRQVEFDLLALEWWHDNDYENIEHEEGSQFVESIGTEMPEDSIAYQAKYDGIYLYPNGNYENREIGQFNYQEFSNSESVGEALDWLQTYLFNWQRNFNDVGPISTEDELYAAVLQEGIDQHTDIESHFWAFDLPEAPASTHGNGLIYDETNNELRIMETITGPETSEFNAEEQEKNSPVPPTGRRLELPQPGPRRIPKLVAPTPIRRHRTRERLARI